MRILAHIHTFNDDDVIDLSLKAILNQTHPVDEILIVDNASTDNTLDRNFPDKVKNIIRHEKNLGTNGSVHAGMQYGLENNFDWIWIFDADSAPRPDALEILIETFNGFSDDEKDKIIRLTSLAVNVPNGMPEPGLVFTPRGDRPVEPISSTATYECHATIWSGSFFRLEAVEKVGLPSKDYVLDIGEWEYGYQSMIRGYKTFVVQTSILDHNINTDIAQTVNHSQCKLGPLTFRVMEFPEIRLYYIVRNGIYFWLYDYQEKSLGLYFHLVKFWSWVPKHIVKLILLRRWAGVKVCIRAVWDGLFKNMHHRY